MQPPRSRSAAAEARPACSRSRLAVVLLAAPAVAEPRHGLSAFGDLKYPADFKHFDYVNPDAPKGGRLSTIGTAGRTTFDSFNNFILKGDAAQGLEYLFDTPDDARAATSPTPSTASSPAAPRSRPTACRSSFKLRPEAKFADGSPVTADDVVFSFDTLKEKGHPQLHAVAARRGEGGGARPADRALHVQGRPRRAICR